MDRLEKIKNIELKYGDISQTSIDWLISEIERLRKELSEYKDRLTVKTAGLIQAVLDKRVSTKAHE